MTKIVKAANINKKKGHSACNYFTGQYGFGMIDNQSSDGAGIGR